MSSYKVIPQEDVGEMKEESDNNDDFDFAFVPHRRESYDFGVYFPIVFMTVMEIILFQYFNDTESRANIATCSLSFSYVRFVYSCLRLFNNVWYETYPELIAWCLKLMGSGTLIWWFKTSLSKEHLCAFECLLISFLLYLCLYKRWSWSDICQHSSKNPDLGAAFAHGTYEGFYVHILSKFREKLTPFSTKNNVPLKKLIILLPLSCSRAKNLIDNDETGCLECCGIFETVARDNGGARERQYNIPKYKVKRQDKKEEFYCFFDVPSSLANLKIIAEAHSQNPEYFDEQFQNYVKFLQDYLKLDTGCINNYLLVPYNDLDANGLYRLPLSRVLELIVDGKNQELNMIHI